MKRDRYVLDEMRNALEGVEDRKAKVERVADLIRSSGSHRWVGIYEVVGGEIAVIAWTGGASAPTLSRRRGVVRRRRELRNHRGGRRRGEGSAIPYDV